MGSKILIKAVIDIENNMKWTLVVYIEYYIQEYIYNKMCNRRLQRKQIILYNR